MGGWKGWLPIAAEWGGVVVVVVLLADAVVGSTGPHWKATVEASLGGRIAAVTGREDLRPGQTGMMGCWLMWVSIAAEWEGVGVVGVLLADVEGVTGPHWKAFAKASLDHWIVVPAPARTEGRNKGLPQVGLELVLRVRLRVGSSWRDRDPMC